MADNPQIFDIPIGNVKGPPGNTGNGISSIALLQTVGLDKTYRITMTDETHYDFTVTDGNGISGVTFNPETYTLTLTFDDGTSYTTGSLRGAPGAPGNDGISPAVTITTITGGHRVTITDRDHPQGQTFDVMDGAGNVTSVAGKTGAVTLDGNDVSFDQEDDYDDGTVGKALKDELNAISAKAPVIINTASGDIASFADGADGMQIRKIVGTIVPVQSGTGDPSPDNVRPISGWTGANIEQSKSNNLLYLPDGALGGGTRRTTGITDGVFSVVIGAGSVSTNQCVSFGTVPAFKRCIPQGTYVFRIFNLNSASLNAANMQLHYEENGEAKTVVNGGTFTVTAEKGALYTAIHNTLQITYSSGISTFSASITPVALDTNTYVKAVRATLPINWQSEAGTIYGGQVTLNEDGSADVVATSVRRVFDSSASWVFSVNETVAQVSISPAFANSYINSNYEVLCNIGEYIRKESGQGSAGKFTLRAYNKNLFIWLSPEDFPTEQAWNAFVSETPVEVYGVISNPNNYSYYHFDNIGSLYTYLGTNNVWIDTGSISECDYPADTKLYIDGLTAPDEDMIADANIASGKYFVVNNQLYLSTAAIAAGASIVPGTNCTATNLAEALNALNT